MQHEIDSTKEISVPSTSAYSAVIIANPKSGSFSENPHYMDETVAFLQEQGWKVEVFYTRSNDEAKQLAKDAVTRSADLVIAVGGDGTIHCIIQELAGTETALGLLPSGTFNVWAKETGIPRDPLGARDVLVNGVTRRIDVGYLNNKEYFLLMAGIGYGGRVTRTVKQESMKRFGVLGYLLVGLRLGLGYDSFPVDLNIDGHTERLRAFQIVIGNTQLYGSLIRFTWRAKADDGLLDMCVVRRPGKLERIVVMIDFLLRLKQRHKWVTYQRGKSIEVRTQKPIAFQLDGEPVGFTPATFTVVPGALKVVVPRETPEGLFAKQPESGRNW